MTDSEYCAKGASMWYKGWIKKDWKTSSGSKVKNDDLWRRIVDLDPERIKFEWVKAHATNEHNNHVDQLANNAANGEVSETDMVARLTKELEQIEKRREEIREKLLEISKRSEEE
jgi:ribonuclease HI